MKPTLVATAALLLMLNVPGTARAGDRPFRASGVATLEGDPFAGTSYDFNGTATQLGAFTGGGHVQFFPRRRDARLARDHDVRRCQW